MTDLPIRAEAVEIAAKAAHEAERLATLLIEPDLDLTTWEEWGEIQGDDEGWSRAQVIEFQRAAIAAFCEAEGLTVEIVGGNNKDDPESQRLVGKWREVER